MGSLVPVANAMRLLDALVPHAVTSVPVPVTSQNLSRALSASRIASPKALTVLTELLTNAIVHAAGPIGVQCSVVGKSLLIDVRDSAAAIPRRVDAPVTEAVVCFW